MDERSEDIVLGERREKGRMLLSLAERYHDTCDAFDNLHLTGPRGRDGRMPANPWQRDICGRHAARVNKDLGDMALAMGFTSQEWRSAIAEAGGRKQEAREFRP